MAPKSLLELQRSRILHAVDSVRPPNKWKVIVLDHSSLRLIENCMKLDDLLHLNATNVELIERVRDPNEFEACYILSPSEANVRRIIEDLSSLGGPQIYPAGHVFFIDGVPQTTVNQLATSAASPRLRGLVELFLDVWPAEGLVTTGQQPSVFHTLFHPTQSDAETDCARSLLEAELKRAINSIVNTCVMLNEFPIIRYYCPSHPPLGPLAPSPDSIPDQQPPQPPYRTSAQPISLRTNGRNRLDQPTIPPPGGSSSSGDGDLRTGGVHFTKLLAEGAAQALDAYVQENQPKQDAHRPRGVLFITDRSMDVRAPLMHEFTYQAMLNDLLPIKDGKYYHYQFNNAHGRTEEKDAILSDDDAVWSDIRHLHIALASQKLSAEFEQHVGKAGKYETGKSLNDMRDMLANLPHMQETKERLSLHLTLAQQCMDVFQNSKLADQSKVEQSYATGLAPDGSKPKDIIVDMVGLLDNPSISPDDKVRIIALYILQYDSGVVDEDRKRLYQHARLSLSEMEAVNNLTYLGARVVKQSSGSAERALSAFSSLLHKSGSGGWKRDQEYVSGEYDTSRFKPLLQYMLKDFVTNKLDSTHFPYVEGHGDNAPTGSSSSMLAGFGVQSSAISSSLGAQRSPAGGPVTSLRSQRPTWANGRASSSRGGGRPGLVGGRQSSNNVHADAASTQQRILCYVVGGMTYSEMRAIYQAGQEHHRDIYLASDTIWTPKDFITQLRILAKPLDAGRNGSTLSHCMGVPQPAAVQTPSPSGRSSHLRPMPLSSPAPSSGRSSRLSPTPTPAPALVPPPASQGYPRSTYQPTPPTASHPQMLSPGAPVPQLGSGMQDPSKKHKLKKLFKRS